MSDAAVRPELLVVVDTEEEFDWEGPFQRSATSTVSIAAQTRAHAIYDRLGVVPTYVLGYPVATDPAAVELLGGLRRDGRARIGAHLHPWVTPPHEETVNRGNSYHCNLPPALERAKIEHLTDAIEAAFGERPTVFKAGRYGFGDNTQRVLVDLGYRVDCSFVPYTSFANDGGPNYYHVSSRPVWLDREQGLLEVPLTIGYFGKLAQLGARMQPLFDSPVALSLRLPGMLARSNLVARSRLSPEGVSAAEQCRLLDSLYRQGQRLFTLCYHSPSLAPGNTPYVQSEADLATFLASIETVLRHFRDVLSGSFTTLEDVHARELAAIGDPRHDRRAVRHG